jgi:hypothetical protein
MVTRSEKGGKQSAHAASTPAAMSIQERAVSRRLLRMPITIPPPLARYLQVTAPRRGEHALDGLCRVDADMARFCVACKQRYNHPLCRQKQRAR